MVVLLLAALAAGTLIGSRLTLALTMADTETALPATLDQTAWEMRAILRAASEPVNQAVSDIGYGDDFGDANTNTMYNLFPLESI